MYTIDREVIQRHLEEMRQEVEHNRIGQKALKQKRKERKGLSLWTIFFSLSL